MRNIILALGGNTGEVRSTFKQAIQKLNSRGIQCLSCASVYKSQSLLKDTQNDYLNTVCMAQTALSPAELLQTVKDIEAELGRAAEHGHWQARTVDIDIIAYGQEIIDTHSLKIPHPHMAERSFVLLPLQELMPDYIHPVTHKSISTMIAELKDTLDIQKIYSDGYANVNGIQLYYQKTANAKCTDVLILLHGNGEDHSIFDKLSDKLAPHFNIYAIDSRNHGQSSKTDVYSYDAMADDLIEFIKAMELSKVNLLGFSDGAIIALLAILKQPELAQKAALLGVNLTPSDFTAENYAYIQNYYDKTGDPLYKMMLEQPNIDIEALRRIKCPVFIIAGQDDIYRPELYSEISAVIPNNRTLIVPEHDHSSYIISNDMLAPYLIDFYK